MMFHWTEAYGWNIISNIQLSMEEIDSLRVELVEKKRELEKYRYNFGGFFILDARIVYAFTKEMFDLVFVKLEESSHLEVQDMKKFEETKKAIEEVVRGVFKDYNVTVSKK